MEARAAHWPLNHSANLYFDAKMVIAEPGKSLTYVFLYRLERRS
jgi:hypothetical protein